MNDFIYLHLLYEYLNLAIHSRWIESWINLHPFLGCIVYLIPEHLGGFYIMILNGTFI